MRACLGAFRRDRDGAVALIVAISMVVLFGFVAMGVELPSWYFAKRKVQNGADAAATAVAMRYANGGTASSDQTSAAEQSLTQNQISAGTCAFGGTGDCVLNRPPTSGSHVGDEDVIEVVLTQRPQTSFSSLFLQDLRIRARAVARAGAASSFCFLALEPTEKEAAVLQNHATLPEQCGLAVNSSDNEALAMSNNSEIQGDTTIVGNYTLQNSAALSGGVTTGASPVDDPYADVSLGSLPSCSPVECTSSGNGTFSFLPGRYCDGCDLGNNSTVNLAPGVYYVDKKFALKNSTVLNGTGVTIVLMDDADLDLGNNATANLTAPTSGPFQGLVFMSEPGAAFKEYSIGNNLHLNVTGAFYFPDQKFTIENHTNTPSGCTQFIARYLHFKNNADLDNNCAGTGVKTIGGGGSAVTLLE